MATLIDSLVISLGLDATKFSTEQKKIVKDLRTTEEEATRTGKSMEAAGAQAAQFFSKIRNEALGLFAVLLGAKGLEDFAAHSVASLSALAKIANDVGTSLPTLEAFRNAVERNGGNADAATASFMKLSQALEMAKFGFAPSGETVTFLSRIGAGIRDTVPDIYKKFNAWAQGRQPQEVIAFGQMGGLDLDTIHQLMRPDYAATLAKSLEQGVPTTETAKRLADLQSAFIGLKQTADNFATTILGNLSPALTDIIDKGTRWLENTDNQKAVTAALTQILADFKGWLDKINWEKVGEDIKTFAADANGAAQAVGGWVHITEALLALWTGAKVAAMVKAVAGLVSLLGTIPIAVAAALAAIGFGTYEGNTGVQERSHGEDFGVDPNSGATIPMPPELREKWKKEHPEDSQGADPSSYSPGVPRGIRNNNPGDLEYKGQQGSTGSDGRFAKFATMADGVAAINRQLQRYAAAGVDTIAKIAAKYAPPGENDTAAYIAGLMKSTGFGANQRLNLYDPDVLARLDKGIITREVGARWANQVNTSSSTAEVNIDEMHVHTQARDIPQTGEDIGKHIKNNLLIDQANSGLG